MERANIVLAVSILCVSEWGIYSGLSLLDGGKEGMVVPVTPTPGLIGSDRALGGGSPWSPPSPGADRVGEPPQLGLMVKVGRC